MGGMFTVFKVRDDITSYVDPGWYQHPEGTVASRVDIDAVPKAIRETSPLQESNPNPSDVSWYSKEEEKRQPQQVPNNWMRSKPEDSMGGGHMQMGEMKGMSPQNMDHSSNMKNMGH